MHDNTASMHKSSMHGSVMNNSTALWCGSDAQQHSLNALQHASVCTKAIAFTLSNILHPAIH
eukprot:1159660-Pelagomonas_calceolata.AAC.14